MNLKASYRYQIGDQIKSISIYYFVLLCVYILLFTTMATTISTDDGSIITGQLSGMEMATIIFIFVAGLCSFKEAFLMMMQNGVSRKTIFVGRILTALTVAIGMATIDRFVLIAFKYLSTLSSDILYCTSLYEQTYFEEAVGMGTLQIHAASYLFDISLYLAFISVGYLITLVFYRLNKTGQLAAGVGVPVCVFVLFPIFDLTVTDGKISSAIGKFLNFAFGISAHKPVNAMITCILAFILFSGISWLLMRRAAVKE